MPPRVVLDLETCSVLDLTRVGAHAYAEHSSTRITVLCYAIGFGPVQTWTGGPPPDDFVAAVKGDCVVVSHNYSFELWMYLFKLVPEGWPKIKLSQWSCTMARALAAGYPASLELVSRVAHLPEQKDASARGLMLRFARPRRLDPDGNPVWWHETDPVRFRDLCAYCAQDVETERVLDRRVPELSRAEHEVFLADHDLNARGLRIDPALVARMQELSQQEKLRINQHLRICTNGRVTSGNQVAKITELLASEGITVPTLRRDDVAELLRDPNVSGVARQVLQARLDVSRASTAKLTAMQAGVSRDGRLRGTVQYYGANRTGRWAGRRVQPQNFFRGTIRDVPSAVHLIESGCTAEDLDLLCEDSPMGVLASCLRATIEAAPGNVLVAADLAQIEARVLAWLADQDDALALFAQGEDIYTYTARAIGSNSRQLGKVLVLACGFGMGPVRFRETALGYGLDLTGTEAEDAVAGFRRVNQKIVTYWWESHRVASRVTTGRVGTTERFGKVTYRRADDALLAFLPSGRPLVYREAAMVKHPDHGHPELTYMGGRTGGGAWVRLRTWPGKLTENLVQAIARDVIASAMVRMHKKGVPLVGTVHDELIAEVERPRGPQVLAWMLWAMKQPVPWARTLPVAAAGFVGERYRKG
jgi:DNA polymerase